MAIYVYKQRETRLNYHLSRIIQKRNALMIDQDSPGEEIAENPNLESSRQTTDPQSQESNRANTCDDSTSGSTSNVAEVERVAESQPQSESERQSQPATAVVTELSQTGTGAQASPEPAAATAIESSPLLPAADKDSTPTQLTLSEPATGIGGVSAARKPSSARQKFKLSDLWWVAASFIVPFTTLALYLIAQNAFAPKLCLRSGLVGTAIAVVIVVLWKIDGKLTGFRAPDVSTELVLRMLGMMLWLVWVGASHVILLATDEVYPPTDLMTYTGSPDRQLCARHIDFSKIRCATSILPKAPHSMPAKTAINVLK
jgi:hypothetical protein